MFGDIAIVSSDIVRTAVAKMHDLLARMMVIDNSCADLLMNYIKHNTTRPKQ